MADDPNKDSEEHVRIQITEEQKSEHLDEPMEAKVGGKIQTKAKESRKPNQQPADRRYVQNPASQQGPQTPVYQQQVVAGKPVYVQGQPPPPPPVDASRTPTHRRGNVDSYDNYIEDPSFGSSFSTKKIRNRFVRKVYTILSVQLLFTCGLIAICIFIPPVNMFVKRHSYLMWIGFAVFTIVYFVLVCFQTLRRTFPLNLVLLAIFTLSFSYMFAVMSAHYSTYIVMSSMGLTCLIVICITLLAMTPIDVTGWGVYLCVISLVFMLGTLIGLIVGLCMGGFSYVMIVLYGSGITLLFSLYLLYDTQQILGGKKIEISPEEYIFGAISLYIDVMYIFYGLMCIFGASNN